MISLHAMMIIAVIMTMRTGKKRKHGNTLAEHIAMMPISCLNAFPTGFMMTCMN